MCKSSIREASISELFCIGLDITYVVLSWVLVSGKLSNSIVQGGLIQKKNRYLSTVLSMRLL